MKLKLTYLFTTRMASLATQLLTVSVLALQRQIYHNRGMNRASWNPSYDFVVVGQFINLTFCYSISVLHNVSLKLIF